MSVFPKIRFEGCNGKMGFYQLRDPTLWVVTADIKAPVLQGSMPSAAPCPGRADPSQ